jgi:hypothetical protein
MTEIHDKKQQTDMQDDFDEVHCRRHRAGNNSGFERGYAVHRS